MNYLSFCRLNQKMSVNTYNMQLLVGLLAVVTAVSFAHAEENLFDDFFPYGVYAVGYNPDDTVKDIKDTNSVLLSMNRSCKDMADHNMNCVWANNLGWDMLPLWLEAGRNHGIRVIPQGGGPGFLRPEKYGDKEIMAKEAEPLYRELAEKYKDDSVLLAWSATEEAGAVQWFYEGMAELTAKMAQWDSNHPMISIDNRAATAWMNATVVKPKVFCNDVYSFFGDGLNGPYRLMGSQNLFRRNCRLFREAAEYADSRFWMMGQGMAEDMYIDGVKAHPLYRYPTPYEIRWQVWAAIQEGAKGFFFYIYQNRTIRENGPVDRGLRDIDGSETEQFRMASEVGSQIKFLMPLLLRLEVAKPHETAVYWDNGPVSSETHIDRKTGRRFIIAVNNDCENIQPINIELGIWPHYVQANDKTFDLRTRRVYDYQTLKVTTLLPGDGTVLFVGTDEEWQRFSGEFFKKN